MTYFWVHQSKLHKGHLDWVILNVCPLQSVWILCGMFRDCGTFGIRRRNNQTGVQKFEGNERVVEGGVCQLFF